jgi:hypothetical protein
LERVRSLRLLVHSPNSRARCGVSVISTSALASPVVNRKTANALGIKCGKEPAARADEVIEQGRARLLSITAADRFAFIPLPAC